MRCHFISKPSAQEKYIIAGWFFPNDFPVYYRKTCKPLGSEIGLFGKTKTMFSFLMSYARHYSSLWLRRNPCFGDESRLTRSQVCNRQSRVLVEEEGSTSYIMTMLLAWLWHKQILPGPGEMVLMHLFLGCSECSVGFFSKQLWALFSSCGLHDGMYSVYANIYGLFYLLIMFSAIKQKLVLTQ